jgi:transposase
VKNLTDYAKQHISKIVSANIRIPAEEGEPGMGGGYWEKPECHGASLPEREHKASTEKKRAVVERVRSLVAQGLTITEAAKEAGVSYPTAKKYMRSDFQPESRDYGTKKPSKLKPYTQTIDTMLREGRAFKEIGAAIRAEGYDGSVSAIRMYAGRQRRMMKDANSGMPGNAELIERKWLTKLLYQPIEKVRGITESQLERVVQEHPVVGSLYYIVRSFKEMLSTKRVNDLDAWIDEASHLGLDELNSFINGITADLDAVKNAIQYEYNNGLAEGSVNKLKVIKRIMYGRCSFELLRSKVLMREANR